MKDMSEEKECQMRDEPCGCRNGVRGKNCFDYHGIEEREEKDEYVHCPRCVDWKNKCKSLESRLSELEYGKLCEANRAHWENRLSQAENFKDGLWMYAPEGIAKEVSALHQRLSHLMDVAGKMALALDNTKKWTSHVAEDCSCKYTRIGANSTCEDVTAALAEWDGIKKEGV